jgi:regulatory protein
MYINKIKKKGKTKYLFFSDGKYSFFLTSYELREYNLYDAVLDVAEDYENYSPSEAGTGIELPDSVYEILLNEVVLPRGKRYALGLLSDRDYTVSGLHDKLTSADYSAEDTEAIMDYIKKYNYLDDVRYATNYIRFREKSKSRKYIEGHLLLKGISKEDILTAYSNIEEEHSLNGIEEQSLIDEAINRKLTRKLTKEDYANQDKITKALQSLIRSGYKYSDVKRCITNYFSEESSAT